MNRKKLIVEYLKFFKSKAHKEIPNASLVPENNPTVLFTTAGMHPLVPYLLEQKHPLGKRLCNVQKCIRTKDIEEVGDKTHHTFFEMLGNWSLGDYFKKHAIEMSFEFLTKVLKIPIEKIGITVFGGDKKVPKIAKDKESASVWKNLGIPNEKIAFIIGGVLKSEDNWWGPAGKTGPCGPSTEMFFWSSTKPAPKKFNPKDENWIEIWNDVFIEYNKNEKGVYEKLIQQNVDTGMGVERTIASLNNLNDDYLTETFKPIIEKIETLSEKKYNSNKKAMRIIADHIKASVFILAEGIKPSNTEHGYVLRRLIRRAVRYGKELKLKNFTKKIAESVFKIYDDYSELKKNKKHILQELEKEEEKFQSTLEKGLNKLKKISKDKKKIGYKDAFLLYQSYGFPIEMTEEIAKEKGITINKKGFKREFKKHQELSRTASIKKFKSGLSDNSEATTKLHTATHLLLSALRIVLKDENIFQKGSNITPERLRLDFSFPRKLTKQELQEVEDLINTQIQKSCEITKQEIFLKEAKKKGIIGTFEKKYPDKVSIYKIADFSTEICAGPHVKNTCELGKFKIKKQESSSAGVRRIKAVLG